MKTRTHFKKCQTTKKILKRQKCTHTPKKTKQTNKMKNKQKKNFSVDKDSSLMGK